MIILGFRQVWEEASHHIIFLEECLERQHTEVPEGFFQTSPCNQSGLRIASHSFNFLSSHPLFLLGFQAIFHFSTKGHQLSIDLSFMCTDAWALFFAVGLTELSSLTSIYDKWAVVVFAGLQESSRMLSAIMALIMHGIMANLVI